MKWKVDGLGLGAVSDGPLLLFEMVSCTALGNVSARPLGPSRMMSSVGQVGRGSAHWIGEMIAPWEWPYMDTGIVACVCSSIAACAAEQEEVCECIKLLAKLFIGIGQQCGCTNANANRKAKKRKKEDNNEGEATQQAEGVEGRQKVGR